MSGIRPGNDLQTPICRLRLDRHRSKAAIHDNVLARDE